MQEPKLEWIDDPVFDRSDDDPVFHTSIKDLLPPKEEQFFKELITKYLEPLAKERECDEKNKIKQELKVCNLFRTCQATWFVNGVVWIVRGEKLLFCVSSTIHRPIISISKGPVSA